MNIIGPLLQLERGQKYIPIILDYATCYMEAVPLQKAILANIANELVLLFSHVGITKDILTDQEATFTSQLTQHLCKLLQVRHVCMSVYHLRTDGLVEQFKLTLKQMSR